MNNFLGIWVNIDPTGGMTRLIIEKVDDNTVSFHGYGKCTRTDCNWGTINVPFTLPKLVGTYELSYKTRRITVERSGNQLLAEVFDDYTEADGRTDRTSNYVLERTFILLQTPVIIIPPLIILTLSP